jgi:cytochrome P450
MRAINYLSDLSSGLLVAVTSRVPYVQKLTSDYRGYVVDQVEKCKARGTADSLVWSRVKQNGSFTQEQQHSIAGEMLLAGTETSATVLSGALYYLLKHGSWLDTLVTDLRLRHGSIEDLSLSTLQGNEILNAVLKETMRLYPAVSGPREDLCQIRIETSFTENGKIL